jgi:hydroxyethylthiazole kinase-like uncharacterized protein yjeF
VKSAWGRRLVKPLLRSEEVRVADATAAARGITVARLMEAAGRAVALWCRRLAGGTYGRRVVVLAGRGNNAGDGFVAARYLAQWGALAEVWLLAPPEGLRGEPRENLEKLAEVGVPLRRYAPEPFRAALARADLAVDAVFGTGLKGPPAGEVAEAISLLNSSGTRVVAVDVPSGVDADTGAVPGAAVQATLTVSLACLKPGLVIYPGAAYAGRVEVEDIGIPQDLLVSDLALVEEDDVRRVVGTRRPEMHKGEAGRVLVVAGSPGFTGAAAMTSEAALRTGAGLVTLAVAESLNPVLEVKLTEAMTWPLPDRQGRLGPEALAEILPRVGEFDVLALGPGLGRWEGTKELVLGLLEKAPLPAVVDADALNLLAEAGGARYRPWPTVYTPHPGEFSRLVGRPVPEVQADRVGWARRAAAAWGGVVVLKGARTVVAAPDGRAAVNPTGNPGMASGGTGDVLTGAIAALLARGIGPFEAAWAGAYLHGLAGDLAYQVLAPAPVPATLLLDSLGPALARIGGGGRHGEL